MTSSRLSRGPGGPDDKEQSLRSYGLFFHWGLPDSSTVCPCGSLVFSKVRPPCSLKSLGIISCLSGSKSATQPGLLHPRGLVATSSPALWSCTPLLTTFGPAVSQACTTAGCPCTFHSVPKRQSGWLTYPGFSASLPSWLHPLPLGLCKF